MRRQISGGTSIAYIVAQTIGGISGTLAAHMMFELPIPQLSTTARTGLSQYFSEIIATFGLLLTLLLVVKHKIEAVPAIVALYIFRPYALPKIRQRRMSFRILAKQNDSLSTENYIKS